MSNHKRNRVLNENRSLVALAMDLIQYNIWNNSAVFSDELRLKNLN